MKTLLIKISISLYWPSLLSPYNPFFISIFFWIGHFARDCLLARAKLFLTTAKEEKLQEDKRLKEYGTLSKRRTQKYKGPEEKSRREEDKKQQEKEEEPQ